MWNYKDDETSIKEWNQRNEEEATKLTLEDLDRIFKKLTGNNSIPYKHKKYLVNISKDNPNLKKFQEAKNFIIKVI